ncbi:hypothetical protein [Natrinema soli]|uniref:Uncharacterized protein n=1 Tax=Natrinema soli TaxID=1930624 RepID=A0ABD5STX9_9EURY|nr:hypothetical protein [Natrinema soli]
MPTADVTVAEAIHEACSPSDFEALVATLYENEGFETRVKPRGTRETALDFGSERATAAKDTAAEAGESAKETASETADKSKDKTSNVEDKLC